MKNLLLILILFCATKNINAQISATTTAGKKVILNLDNKTWDWANPQDNQKPCYTNHRANIYIHNNTNKDIYLYYSNMTYDMGGNVQYIKLKAGAHRLIEDLYTRSGNTWQNINDYKWVVSYELFENVTETGFHISKIKGFDSGNFKLEDCETKDIKIYD